MDIQSEIHMLRIGLSNRDFRPGAERENAQRRLTRLLVATADTQDRPRGVITLRSH